MRPSESFAAAVLVRADGLRERDRVLVLALALSLSLSLSRAFGLALTSLCDCESVRDTLIVVPGPEDAASAGEIAIVGVCSVSASESAAPASEACVVVAGAPKHLQCGL